MVNKMHIFELLLSNSFALLNELLLKSNSKVSQQLFANELLLLDRQLPLYQ